MPVRLVLALPEAVPARERARLEALLPARGSLYRELPASARQLDGATLQQSLLEVLRRHGAGPGEAVLLASRYREEVLPAAGLGLLALLPSRLPPDPAETAYLGPGPAPRWAEASALLEQLDLLERLPPREPRRPGARPLRTPRPGPAAARAAASVILHDRHGQLLFVRRAEIPGSIAPGSWAFPGGMVEPADREPDGTPGQRPLSPLLQEAYRGTGAEEGDLRGLQAAALRELAEETGLELEAEALLPLGRLLAPPYVPRRVETAYFLARYPEGQPLRLSPDELMDSRWLRPKEALAGYRTGQLFMTLPTLAAVAPLVALASAPEAWERQARAHPGRLIRPGSEIAWALRLLPQGSST